MTETLAQITRDLKLDILRMFYHSQTGHLASALSCIELLTVLYFSEKQVNEHVILSKGHGAAALYAILAKQGVLPREELKTFYGYNSRLLALASCTMEGIPIPTGSLGQGVCFASGIAKAYQMDQKNDWTYCILGDGEMQEGSVWEMAMFAANQHLNHFIVILDHNNIQASGRIEDVAPVEPVRKKWEAFGWNVEEVNGHNVSDIQHILQQVKKRQAGGPTFIIAHTVKGNGISFLAGRPDCHMRNPKNEEWLQVCEEFHITMEELKQL